MKMYTNIQRIAPRAQALAAKEKLRSKPLSKDEFAVMLSFIKASGIENGFQRLADDFKRFTIDQLLDAGL